MDEPIGTGTETGVAVVGMAGRFPGAPTVDVYWRNVRDGVESITFFERERLLAVGIPEQLLNDRSYVAARGTLEGCDLFDAPFFGYSPREATIMDPQQRIFLECSWEALESAGYDPKTVKGLIGVYGGATASSYMPLVYADPHVLSQADPLSIAIGNDIAFLTTRVSYKLDLRGPSCPVQTACSTALVAIHLACQGLLNAECDLALAGGVSVRVPQESGYMYQAGGILSPDGHCRPFDASAQGTLFSNGLGVVVLKRLQDALADRDFIYAVIRGSAINNDGSHKASFTAPAVGGQSDVIADALMHADIEPETIRYIETHGTATALGDSIEMQALNRVFPTDRARQYCAIGSVKSNIGHLDAAAGAASFIKAALALWHRQLPPSLHYARPNSDIDFANSAFYVNSKLAEWKRTDGVPRRAGVSSFGFGGTNAHVILEEAPASDPPAPSRPWQLLTLSAENDAALEAATTNLAAHLRTNPQEPIADAAYTLKVGRRGFRHRRIVVCHSADDAVRAIDTRDPAAVLSASTDGGERPVVFMFPGQGAQHVNMGRDLYMEEPIFRGAVDECAEALAAHLDVDLREVLYPSKMTDEEEAAARLRRTRFAQPALFVIEYALARLWQGWGVKPEACIGHSIGEYVAACLAGVLDLPDALKLVATRGALMEAMPEGVMLAVPLSEDRVRRMLEPGVWLSVVNGPSMCVVSGTLDAIDKFDRRLQEQGTQTHRLHTSHAFHSGLMDGAVAPLVRAASSVELREPRIPYLSNVTGTWIEASQARDPEYWGKQLREPVRFGDGVAELLKRDQRVFLEVGPGQTLSMLVRQQAKGRAANAVFPTLRHARQAAAGSDFGTAMTTLGRLWLSGVDVSWSIFYRDELRRRVPLPTYPFQRQRYWVNPVSRAMQASALREERTATKTRDVGRWFYTPAWRRTPGGGPRVNLASLPRTTWIVFTDESGVGEALVGALRSGGQRAVEVERGGRFERLGPDRFRLDASTSSDYRSLVETVADADAHLAIVHLWSLGSSDAEGGVDRLFDAERSGGFDSVLALSQALGSVRNPAASIDIAVVTAGAQDVTGVEVLSPGASPLLGLCRVIPQEYPEIGCKSIDTDALAGIDASGRAALANRLLQEVLRRGNDRVVAHRGAHRWTLAYDQVRLEASAEPPSLLRDRGVYLITGGLGDIGLNVAEYLARTVNARLLLTGRTVVPPRAEWAQYLATRPSDDPIAARIRRLERIEAAGGDVLVVRADVSAAEDMDAAFAAAEARFGAVNGVIHAAGLVTGDAFRPITETDAGICARQFAPKIIGLCVLDRAIRRRRESPDFVVLVSSLSAILGGLRFAAYASANAFLDTFAAWRHRAGGCRWLTVNWDSWMRADDEARLGETAANSTDLIMTSSEGVEAFHRLLAADVGHQVAVSTGNLQARINQWIALEAVRDDAAGAAAAARHPRPNLQTEYRAPADALEQALATIWQDLLGIDRVGVNDSFFELGGDSLLGVQVIARVKKQLAVAVSAVSLYEGPTVARLAAVIRASETTPQLDQSRSRGEKRREHKIQRQLQVAG